MTASLRTALLSLLIATTVPLSTGCTDSTGKGPNSALNEQASKWLERAKASYAKADLDDARDAIQSALSQAPESSEVKEWAGRVYLARLEWDEAVRVLTGVQTPDAHGLKGRAHWYAGELDQAADELELVMQDPSTNDAWAKAISKLARQGHARKPFQVTGGLLAPVQMQRIRSAHLVVPIDINGEPALALVATNKGEVVLDSATRKEPSWVQLRFAERIEVSDVPALVEDLSGISKEVGAPIKALLGVNMLRRLNITFDFLGEQFVVRTREPSPPPKATRVPLAYALGGAMVARASLKGGSTDMTPLLVNTLLPYPLGLDDKGFQLAEVDPSALQVAQGGQKGKAIPFMRLGAFDLPEVPAIASPSFSGMQAATGMDVNGAIGAGLLALFRCTFTDGGKALWIEDPEQLSQSGLQGPAGEQPSGPAPQPSGPAGEQPAPQLNGPAPLPSGSTSPGAAPAAPAPAAPAPAGGVSPIRNPAR